MPKVRDILDALEAAAPRRFAFSFDKVGLQVGDPDRQVLRCVVSLDRSLGAVQWAVEQGAQMLVTHHPLIFDPVATITATDHVGRTLLKLAETQIALAAAHTNWDSARGGINDALCEKLGLTDVEEFGGAAFVQMHKLVVFVPHESVEKVAQAAHAAGAGQIGEYRECSFRTDGIGTFRGGASTNPVVGKPGELERVSETRLEILVRAELSEAVRSAVLGTHPYEEPVFEFVTLLDVKEQPAGRIGVLPHPMMLSEMTSQVERQLPTKAWAWGEPSTRVHRVAVVGGAADGEWSAAKSAGADVFLTGEVRQHVALEASEWGLPIVAAGHYATEHPGCEALSKKLAGFLPEVEFDVFVPAPGLSGRPLG